MAASRRSPLMRDQWRAEDDEYRASHYRDQDRPYHRDRSPPPARRTEASERGVRIKGRPTGDSPVRGGGSPERKPTRSSGREVDRSLRHSPRRKVREEGSKRTRESSEERNPERSRPRESSRPPYKSRKARSPAPDRSHRHSELERRRTRSPRQTDRGVDRGDRRRERAYSPSYSPRRSKFSSSRDYPKQQSDRSARDSYIPSSRRGRSRSPVTDHYRPDSSRRRSRSPDRHRHRREEHQHRDHSKGNESPRRDKNSFLPTKYSPTRTRTPSPTKTKSSKRSEKQKQRTLKHLYEKAKKAQPDRTPSPCMNEEEDSRMQSSTRPIQSILDERQPSPPRPIPSFDDSNGVADAHMRGSFPMHGMKASDIHGGPRHFPGHIETRQQYAASPQWTPTSSHHGSPHHGSPHSASPYSQGRGGWGGQPQYMGQHGPPMVQYSPPFRQNSYPPPNQQYYPNQQHVQYPVPPPQQMQHGPGFQSPSYRGGHGMMRGGGHFSSSPDRRFSGSNTPSYGIQAPRGRGGHFQNLQWTASGGTRGGKQTDQAHGATSKPQGKSRSPSAALQQLQPDNSAVLPNDNAFEPPSAFQVVNHNSNSNDFEVNAVQPAQNAQPPPPAQEPSNSSQQSKESSKISFAFKAKAVPPSAKPVPDLAEKMKESSPARKEAVTDSTKSRSIFPTPTSKGRTDRHVDPYSERRDERRERGYRDEPRYKDDRRGEPHPRDDHRPDPRYARRPERQRDPSPEIIKVKKIMKRMKARPTLPSDFAASDSVYYRKPGNESVVGSGTYGKVFKAIHVYTKSLVALKKIRMEGEKDGFPVTAVREIKLLQSLKHDSIVSLQEVMVEKNDCFMVFEYLSHDLTGLLNHPTYKLEHSHKKHLAKQLFEGLDYLHRRGVLHRDIKAANILVSSSGQLKLADFGLARFYAKRRQLDYTNRVITIWYRPPELLLGETQYGAAVDIWSAACVMIEIFTKHAIFPGDGGEINQLEKVYNILGTPTRAEWPGLVDMAWFELMRPAERKPNVFAEKYRERLTPAAFELLQAMFLYDPAKRPTAGDVLEHPYFTAEEPTPVQAFGLKDLQGDWHEFESKALRRENERKDKEARRAVRLEEHDREKGEREKAKRKANGPPLPGPDRDPKRPRPDAGMEGPAADEKVMGDD